MRSGRRWAQRACACICMSVCLCLRVRMLLSAFAALHECGQAAASATSSARACIRSSVGGVGVGVRGEGRVPSLRRWQCKRAQACARARGRVQGVGHVCKCTLAIILSLWQWQESDVTPAVFSHCQSRCSPVSHWHCARKSVSLPDSQSTEPLMPVMPCPTLPVEGLGHAATGSVGH